MFRLLPARLSLITLVLCFIYFLPNKVYSNNFTLEEEKNSTLLVGIDEINSGDIPGEQVAHSYSPSDKISGYLVYLPKDYNANPTKKYPVVVFFHGAGEVGTNIERLKVTGVPKMIAQGKDFPFIVIAPQARYTFDNNSAHVDKFLNDVTGNYRIDHNRLYVTGLSMGGAATWYYATNYPEKVAAAVPICGWGNPSAICAMKNVPVWAFHNQGDATVGVSSTINTVNALKNCPSSPKQTIYPVSGHDAWTTTYNNQAVWDWMLSQSKSGTIPAPAPTPPPSTTPPPPSETNRTPIVNAGSDKELVLPENSTMLFSSSYDPDGSIATYQWTKSAGPGATMVDANKPNVKLSNLSAGEYIFKLTVTDNGGGKAYDEVNLSVVGSTSEPVEGEVFYVNFNSSSNQGQPWNNTASNPYVNKKLSGLKNHEGKSTNVSLTFLTGWGGSGSNSSASTNLYPTNVAKTYYWTNSHDKEVLKVGGLNNTQKYSFTFYGYRSGSGDKTTNYTIGSKTVSLNAANNLTNSVQIQDVSPNANGEITISVRKGSGSSFGYLNSMVINAGSTAEAKPGDGTSNVGEIVYRINAGGNSYTQSPKNWDRDNRTSSSVYLSSTSASDTYDHSTWGTRTNTTDAPDYVLKSNRYEASWSNSPMAYKLPLPNGKYKVNLYFAEYQYSGIKKSGQRVFHVSIENIRQLSNFDIFATAGNGAVQKTFTVDVKDNNLDIKFEKLINKPQINGIEVIRISDTFDSSIELAQQKISHSEEIISDIPTVSVYPNPVLENIFIDYPLAEEKRARVTISDILGKVYLEQEYNLQSGNKLNLDATSLPPGLLLLTIEYDDKSKDVHKLIKK